MTRVSPTLLADAVADAKAQLAKSEATDIDDHTQVVGSQAALTATLRRVLWVLDAEVA